MPAPFTGRGSLKTLLAGAGRVTLFPGFGRGAEATLKRDKSKRKRDVFDSIVKLDKVETIGKAHSIKIGKSGIGWQEKS